MDPAPHNEASGDNEEIANPYRSIIEAVRDGVFVVNLDGTITYVNDSLCSLIGRERNELVGETFDTLVASGLVQSDEFDRFVTAINNIADGEPQNEVLTFEIGQETEQVVDVRVSKHLRDDGTEDLVGVVRDVTELERRARAAEQKQEVLAKLYQVGAETGFTFEQKAERILSIGCVYLNLPWVLNESGCGRTGDCPRCWRSYTPPAGRIGTARAVLLSENRQKRGPRRHARRPSGVRRKRPGVRTV